ncbi:MAG: hypothetical protein JWM02_1664 [Frankiales bacterium]|nr:hypothetical protein [Frankiales bacterium]
MSEFDQIPLADTSDMVGLHRVFREALSAAPTLVGSVAAGDRSRADVVGSYYANVLSLLHVHHEGEDELLTPRLLDRSPADAATLARIAAQHGGVLEGIAAAEGGLATWQAEPTAAAREALTGALATLDAQLSAHLDEEEQVVLPIAARHINAAEWGELPGHGMRHFGGDKLWLILGLIQEQMSPEQVAIMEAHMPPPVAESWTQTGRGLFRDYIDELRV